MPSDPAANGKIAPSDDRGVKVKTCTKCKTEKNEAEFPKDKSQSDGLKYHCKACMREYRQTDAYKEYRRAYRQTDVYKKSQEKHQQTDTFKEYQKAYQQRDTFKEYQKTYKQRDTYKVKNREYAKAYYLRKKAEAAGNNVLSGTN